MVKYLGELDGFVDESFIEKIHHILYLDVGPIRSSPAPPFLSKLFPNLKPGVFLLDLDGWPRPRQLADPAVAFGNLLKFLQSMQKKGATGSFESMAFLHPSRWNMHILEMPTPMPLDYGSLGWNSVHGPSICWIVVASHVNCAGRQHWNQWSPSSWNFGPGSVAFTHGMSCSAWRAWTWAWQCRCSHIQMRDVATNMNPCLCCRLMAALVEEPVPMWRGRSTRCLWKGVVLA